MLILSRRPGESIIAGNNLLEFRVLGLHGHQVKVGINAPSDMPIHREEIYDRLNAEPEQWIPIDMNVWRECCRAVADAAPEEWRTQFCGLASAMMQLYQAVLERSRGGASIPDALTRAMPEMLQATDQPRLCQAAGG